MNNERLSFTQRNRFYDSDKRYDLDKDVIFVFGSNYQGRHGKGAAKDALDFFGAIYGRGEGFQGQAYGIPTKVHPYLTLNLKKIEQHVQMFKRFVFMHPDLCFFVTAVGTGEAGYPASLIAPMFKGVERCWFPDAWEPYLNITI